MKFASTILAFALAADAHMLLASPKRFPGQDTGNGPLNGPETGASNYPCKMASPSYAFDFERTKMPVGSNQTVSFTGSIVHGGGSCQFSISKDLEPSKSSVFKVIHSIEGGCPGRNTPGNRAGGADVADPDLYNFSIPSDVEPGQYTFAWTWFNKVGNREMYMNCAPIEITGGSSKRDEPVIENTIDARASGFDSLPNMFLANVPDVTCASPPEGSNANPKFPEPGSSVESNVSEAEKAPFSGTCYAPVGTSSSPSGGSGSGSGSGAGSGSSSAPPSITTPINDDPIVKSPDDTGAGSGSGSGSGASPTAVAPVPTAALPPVPPTGAPSTGGSCLAGQSPCTGNGSIVCISASQFGLCNFGCMVPQAVAAGTTCANGSITRKRSVRVSRHERFAEYNRQMASMERSPTPTEE